MKSVADLIALNGRRAFVSGGAGHVASAAEEALVELGATVAVVDREEVACRERADSLNRTRAEAAFPLPCDLADPEAVREAVRAAVSRMGGLDVVIHCAAFTGTSAHPGWAAPFAEQSVDAWNAAIAVDLTAAFVLAQSASTALTASGHGTICLLSSIYGMVGPVFGVYEGTNMANPAAYGADKGGIIQLTRYLAAVLAPAVRVNCISPGGISRAQPLAFVTRYKARTLLGRMATEEDLKGAVAYLVSDLSAYVTGHNLVVDGGWTAV